MPSTKAKGRRSRPRRREPPWAGLGDEELLELRFCDLDLKIAGTPLEERIDTLYFELERRGLLFRPHCWLAEEWFSPDGVPGIAIPFYLAHPRLQRLEGRQMLEVEGSTEQDCLRILRHEAGHAIATAYRLHRRQRWRRIFGSASKPYPEFYRPRTLSKSFVLHLGWWYAQSHPSEDFAETFAVWLRPGSRWRSQYQGWPALRKLEYVGELMEEIAGATPPVHTRRFVEPTSRLRKTLAQHYAERRARYRADDYSEVYDRDLRRVFTDNGGRREGRRSAAAYLRRHRAELRELVARGTGEHPYAVDQVLSEMIVRCRELRLEVDPADASKLAEVSVLLSVQMLNYVHTGRHRVPL